MKNALKKIINAILVPVVKMEKLENDGGIDGAYNRICHANRNYTDEEKNDKVHKCFDYFLEYAKNIGRPFVIAEKVKIDGIDLKYIKIFYFESAGVVLENETGEKLFCAAFLTEIETYPRKKKPHNFTVINGGED